MSRLLRLPGSGSSTDPVERQATLVTSVGAILLMTIAATFSYVLPHLVEDLDATTTQTDVMRQAASLAALLILFVAGAVGQRLGPRRVMLAAAACYAGGSLVMAVAPVMPIATIGLVIADVGRSAFFVVAVAAISATVTGKEARAAAFSAIAAAAPIAYIIMPLIAGVLLNVANWRWVAGAWALCGAAALVMIIRWRPAAPAKHSTGEMWTPALAGVALAALLQTITLANGGVWGVELWMFAVIGLAALGILVILMRRMSNPTMTIAPLRDRRLVLLLFILALSFIANLWFYTTLALQYIYGLTPFETAVVLLPAQVANIVGSAMAAKAIPRLGLARAGALLLAINAVLLFGSALVSLSTPIWLIVAILCGYSLTMIGAGITMTNAIMDQAAKSDSGFASAYRSATANIAAAISVIVMTGIVFATGSASLAHQADQAGLNETTTSEVASALSDGQTSSAVSTEYAVPADVVAEISQMQTDAYLVAYRTQGLVGGAITLLAAVLFYVVLRRKHEAAV